MISLEALYQKLKQLFQEGILKIDVSGSDIATETTLSSINGKITKADTDNVKVVDEVAYDDTNDRKKVSIENDAVGLAKESTLSSLNSKVTKVNTDAIKTIWDYMVEQGNAFEAGEIFSIASDSSVEVLLANPSGSGKTVKIRLLAAIGKVEGKVERYVGTYGSGKEISITTGGTQIPRINKKPDSPNTSVVVLEHGGTYSNSAEKVIKGVIPGGSGVFAQGGQSTIGLAGIIPEGYANLIKITNDSASTDDFSILLEWWEE